MSRCGALKASRILQRFCKRTESHLRLPGPGTATPEWPFPRSRHGLSIFHPAGLRENRIPGLLVAGPIATHTSITAVVVGGAMVAMLLAANAARPALRSREHSAS